MVRCSQPQGHRIQRWSQFATTETSGINSSAKGNTYECVTTRPVSDTTKNSLLGENPDMEFVIGFALGVLVGLAVSKFVYGAQLIDRLLGKRTEK